MIISLVNYFILKSPGDCLSHWLFEKGNCTGKVKSGRLGSFHPNATSLINPELALPKVKLKSVNSLA